MLVFPLCPAPWKKQVAPAARPTPGKKSNFWIALWIFTFVPPHGFLSSPVFIVTFLFGGKNFKSRMLKAFKMALFVLSLCVPSILLKFWYWHWNLYLFDTVEASESMVYFTFKRLNTRIEYKRIPCIYPGWHTVANCDWLVNSDIVDQWPMALDVIPFCHLLQKTR